MTRSAVSNRRRESQSGYALLMIFLMAAIVALMLYQQLPRVAFESERDKEQLLIDRGEQYTRAIQLYYLANNRRYPTSIDDLEKREKRFLRRRYLDPFTGKDEWRIVHTNGAFLTDSLVQKPPAGADGKTETASNSTNPATAGIDQTPQVNAAVLQRPSDRPVTPPTGFVPQIPNQEASMPPTTERLPPITILPQVLLGQARTDGLPPITLQPGGGIGLPPITLAPTNPGQVVQPSVPGQVVPGPFGQVPVGLAAGNQPPPGGLPPGIGGLPPGFQIDASGQLVPINPGQGQTNTGLPGGGPGGLPPGFIPGFPGQGLPPANQPSVVPGAVGSNAPGSPAAAVNAINQILTNPRGSTPATPTTSNSNQVGAIAGVASTHKGPSIKVYKDQGQYEMWEFVFNPTALLPGAPGNPGQPPNGGPNPPGGANPTNPFGGIPIGGTPFGGNPGGFVPPQPGTNPTRR